MKFLFSTRGFELLTMILINLLFFFVSKSYAGVCYEKTTDFGKAGDILSKLKSEMNKGIPAVNKLYMNSLNNMNFNKIKVECIQGNKKRIDDGSTSEIIDLLEKRKIVINHSKKTYKINPLVPVKDMNSEKAMKLFYQSEKVKNEIHIEKALLEKRINGIMAKGYFLTIEQIYFNTNEKKIFAENQNGLLVISRG